MTLPPLQTEIEPKPKRKITKKKIRKMRYKGNPENAYFKRAWKDPEFAAKQRERLSKPIEGRGRVAGQPDGMRLKQFLKLKEAALVKKEKVLKAMAKKFEADNDIAQKALDTAVEILLLPGANQIRLQAAKTLLEYTQRKPVVANEVNLKTAEAFLDELAEEGDSDK